MERAWAAGGAAEEIMEDIEQTWAASGDAEGELELAHLRASQAAKIDARHNRLQWLDELEEDGNGGDEAQGATLRPAWQGQITKKMMAVAMEIGRRMDKDLRMNTDRKECKWGDNKNGCMI